MAEGSGRIEAVAAYDSELEAAKERMRGIDENLKSLTGGRLILPVSRRGGPPGGRGGGIGRIFNAARGDVGGNSVLGRRRLSYPDNGGPNANMEPIRKRMRPSLEGRLGAAAADEPYDDPDVPHRAHGSGGLQSAVLMAPQNTKSREVAITELEAEVPKEVKSRNRRMFGMLLGTLSGFRRDERKTDKFKEQERKQKEVEAKLEAEKTASREERESAKASLFAQRQEQEEEIFRLQRRKTTTFIAEKEMAHLRLLQPFIQTKARPPIFYRPKLHSLRTIELQKKTEKKIQELIEKKQEKLETDLAQIDEKNAIYKSRIPNLKKNAVDDEDHKDGDTSKEPGEVGEEIDGDSEEKADKDPGSGKEDEADPEAAEEEEAKAEDEEEDAADAIINDINEAPAAPEPSAEPPTEADE